MPEFCAHLGYLFADRPLEERFERAAANGFRWVEHPAPYGFGVGAFANACRTHGLSVAQIAAPSGDPPRGEKGFACLEGREAAFRESVDRGLEAADRIGATFLHIMPGCIATDTDAERARLLPLYTERIAWAADRAAAAGQRILLEPIDNGAVPGFFLNDPRMARDLLATIDRDNAFMLFDSFHAVNRGLDPVAFWQQAGGMIGHIQIADAPGRHEPGSGTIDYAAFFRALDAGGYGGVVGLEYKPAGDTEAGLGWRDAYV
ncbi:hydroxypyruvate isomerase family protein [Oceanomicrobium pacificus]|uniref:TIM barrel protein n=1 Tax=Oceanomicrobium pacificus TaxID=2692916 RepID=A0A6B0TWC0_9RHOB|nr:TIM barrel protein [Oceanomicrobium pacificus]MXU66035.1 TIM barrel protein [Oceanomicrobium pacificus]